MRRLSLKSTDFGVDPFFPSNLDMSSAHICSSLGGCRPIRTGAGTVVLLEGKSINKNPRPHVESNHDLAFRKRPFYPLNYRGGEKLIMRKHNAD